MTAAPTIVSGAIRLQPKAAAKACRDGIGGLGRISGCRRGGIMRTYILGEDIKGWSFGPIIVAFWPRLFVGTRKSALNVYGSVYGPF